MFSNVKNPFEYLRCADILLLVTNNNRGKIQLLKIVKKIFQTNPRSGSYTTKDFITFPKSSIVQDPLRGQFILNHIGNFGLFWVFGQPCQRPRPIFIHTSIL